MALGLGIVGVVIVVFLIIGIVHFCWRKCHSAQPDQHANSNIELGPRPPLSELP